VCALLGRTMELLRQAAPYATAGSARRRGVPSDCKCLILATSASTAADGTAAKPFTALLLPVPRGELPGSTECTTDRRNIDKDSVFDCIAVCTWVLRHSAVQLRLRMLLPLPLKAMAACEAKLNHISISL
jgi:hypothetical protein